LPKFYPQKFFLGDAAAFPAPAALCPNFVIFKNSLIWALNVIISMDKIATAIHMLEWLGGKKLDF